MIKICIICGKKFEAQRSNTLYCSRHCRNAAAWKRQREKNNQTHKVCVKCGKPFIPNPSGWTRRYCFDCIPDGSATSGADMRRYIKQWALDYKGHKCELCGYDKCDAALDFHHLDPNKKDFSISDRNLICDWGLIKPELDKCIIVCANCHRELHYKEGLKIDET